MADEPDWQLLPRYPQKFFGLENSWERRDLKRAYNRLIKLYRPEKEPEKFRQIRAAYEQLTEELEWCESFEKEADANEPNVGNSPQDQPAENGIDAETSDPSMNFSEEPGELLNTEGEDSSESPVDFDQMDPPDKRPMPKRYGPVDFDGRDLPPSPTPVEPELEIRVPVGYAPPEGQYNEYDDYNVLWGRARTQVLNWLEAGAEPAEIVTRLEAEPRDFRDAEHTWMRAFVADLLDPTGWRFVEVMLEELPRDECPLIRELFQAYLKNRDDELDAETLLNRARANLPEAEGYTLLMPLWLEIFDHDTENFWKVFDALQPSFNLHGQYLAFIVQLLSKRGLQMPLEKFNELFHQVDTQHDLLPMMLQEHLDFMHAFAAYREAVAVRPADTDGLHQLEKAIIDFADIQGGWKIARNVLVSMSQQMHHEWFNANFPVDHPLVGPASEMTMIMTHELGLAKDQLMEDFARPDFLNHRLNRHLHAAFQTTDSLPTSPNVWVTVLGRMSYKVFINLVAPIGLCVIIQNIAPALFEQWSVLIVIAALLAFILGYKYKLSQYEYKIGLKAVMERDRKFYRKYWRLYLLDFIGQNQATTTIIFNLLRMSELPDSYSLFECAAHDQGLVLYSSLATIDPNAPERRWRYGPF